MDKKIVATLIVSAIAVAAFTGIGYSFSAMTYNNDNSATMEYVVLTEGRYSFGSGGMRFGTVGEEVPSTFTVTSAQGSQNTVLSVVLNGCGNLYEGEHLTIRVSSFYESMTRLSRADLTVTDDPSDNEVTLTANSMTGTGEVGAASSDSTFTLTVTVNRLISQAAERIHVTVMRTLYEVKGGTSLCTVDGTAYKGTAVGSDTVTATRSGSEGPVLVKLRSPVQNQFRDLSGTGWMYVIALTMADGQSSENAWDASTQYAYYYGNGSVWSYTANGGLKLTDGVTYDMSLYVAGKTTGGGFGSPFRPADPSDDTIIDGGIIQFTYDSTI